GGGRGQGRAGGQSLEDRGRRRTARRGGRHADDPRVDEDGDTDHHTHHRHGDGDPRQGGRGGAGGPDRSRRRTVTLGPRTAVGRCSAWQGPPHPTPSGSRRPKTSPSVLPPPAWAAGSSRS